MYEDKKVLIVYDLKFVVNFDDISYFDGYGLSTCFYCDFNSKKCSFTTKEFFDS